MDKSEVMVVRTVHFNPSPAPSPASTSSPSRGTSPSRWWMLLGLLALARAPVELAEAEVAVGDDQTHFARVAERERTMIVIRSVRREGRIGVSNLAQKQMYPCRLTVLFMFPGELERRQRFPPSIACVPA